MSTDDRMLPSPLWPELPDERTLGKRVDDAEAARRLCSWHAEADLLVAQQARIEQLERATDSMIEVMNERQEEIDAVNAAHDKLLTEHIAVMDERNQLRRDLEAARDELSDRRKHMRRGMQSGVSTARACGDE